MRLIGTLSNENQARRFAQYLTDQGIANNCEVSFDAVTGHMSYQLWIHEEDKIALATTAFEQFQKKPSDPQFETRIVEVPGAGFAEEPELPPPSPPIHRFHHHLTSFFLALCAFLYFLNTLQELSLRKEGLSEKALTPLQEALMFDIPAGYQGNLEEIQTPYWQGIYDWVVAKMKKEDLTEGPLFVRIRQGEIWRLFTPAILHRDLLHILFNMLWLWYLGRPIEERIGPLRTLLLTLIAGIGSNTIQYFMSGPFFIGYSGIITGLAGFIWMRERLAPWEGYPLNKATILFLLFFIGAIFCIQVVAFFIQVFSTYNFAPNIANTAHIAGAVIGAFLGRLHFFAQRVKS